MREGRRAGGLEGWRAGGMEGRRAGGIDRLKNEWRKNTALSPALGCQGLVSSPSLGVEEFL